MLKIGLTGGIGSGKSTVSKILIDEGIKIIDADKIARSVLIKYPGILNEIVNHFGNKYLNEDGTLNRRKFGSFIFSNDNRRNEYESIILPYIFKDVWDEFKFLEDNNVKVAVLDAPTLIETQMYKHMDVNILVWVDIQTQFKRVSTRDLLSRDEVAKRIKSQMPLEDKKKYVNFVIDNSKDLVNTENQVKKILSEIEEML